MSDDVQAQADEQAQGKDETQQDVSKTLAEMRETLERQKAEIAGLNRAVSEREAQKQALEDEAEQAKRSKMSEIEKLRSDFEASESRRRESERMAEMERNRSSAKDLLREAELPADMLDLLDMSSPEALADSFERVQKSAAKLRESVAADYASKYGKAAPKTGQGEAVPVPKSYRDAKTKEEKIAFLKSQRG